MYLLSLLGIRADPENAAEVAVLHKNQTDYSRVAARLGAEIDAGKRPNFAEFIDTVAVELLIERGFVESVLWNMLVGQECIALDEDFLISRKREVSVPSIRKINPTVIVCM